MKRKVFWLILAAFCAGILLFVVAIFSVDPVARLMAERSIREETGMETSIGSFDVGLSSSTVRIENLVLKNPPEFGGGTFLEIPELNLEMDRNALRNGKLRLKSVRINVRQIHLVENKDGKRNIDKLQKRSRNSDSSSKPRDKKSSSDVPFDGIDLLNVTLRVAKFTSLRDPKQNMETDFAIQNETFRDLKTENDFQTAVAVLAIKAGVTFLLSGGDFSDSAQFFNKTKPATEDARHGEADPTQSRESATNSNKQ